MLMTFLILETVTVSDVTSRTVNVNDDGVQCLVLQHSFPPILLQDVIHNQYTTQLLSQENKMNQTLSKKYKKA